MGAFSHSARTARAQRTVRPPCPDQRLAILTWRAIGCEVKVPPLGKAMAADGPQNVACRLGLWDATTPAVELVAWKPILQDIGAFSAGERPRAVQVRSV